MIRPNVQICSYIIILITDCGGTKTTAQAGNGSGKCYRLSDRVTAWLHPHSNKYFENITNSCLFMSLLIMLCHFCVRLCVRPSVLHAEKLLLTDHFLTFTSESSRTLCQGNEWQLMSREREREWGGGERDGQMRRKIYIWGRWQLIDAIWTEEQIGGPGMIKFEFWYFWNFFQNCKTI